MLTTDGRVLELVKQKIETSRQETREILEYGQTHVVTDHATYRQFVGYLSGLAFIDKAIAEAREQAEQEAGAPPRTE